MELDGDNFAEQIMYAVKPSKVLKVKYDHDSIDAKLENAILLLKFFTEM